MSAVDGVSVDFLVSIAKLGGERIREQIGLQKNVGAKMSGADLVTETDVAVEKLIREQITKTFPNHLFLCEESAEVQQTLGLEPTWIIDPIDGTTNFVHSFPFVCVSIAFAQNGEVQHAVVFNPILDMLFKASKGHGAWLCSTSVETGEACPFPPRKLQVSRTMEFSKALVATGFCADVRHRLEGHADKPKYSPEVVVKLEEIRACSDKNYQFMVSESQNVRAFGSAALSLCFVAAGYVDCYAELWPKEWDVAAGRLIVEEAGGHCFDFSGRPAGNMHERNFAAASTLPLKEVMGAKLRCPKFSMPALDLV